MKNIKILIMLMLAIAMSGCTYENDNILVDGCGKPNPPVPAGMVLIPAGTFQMGNTGKYSSSWTDDEKPGHTVTISKSFYMSKYEVTQKQYESVMGANPSSFNGDSLPAENVNWYDAVEFCNKLSEKEGLTKCYTINGTNVSCNWEANGYRLPTEAEWEYACKAGTTTDTYLGNIFVSLCEFDSILNSIGWYCGNSGVTKEVGKKFPNAFGLYDIIGNVTEWCWDWYNNTYYVSSDSIDPKGAEYGSSRSLRGGSWFNYASYTRSSTRYGHTPETVKNNCGFRIVRKY